MLCVWTEMIISAQTSTSAWLQAVTLLEPVEKRLVLWSMEVASEHLI